MNWKALTKPKRVFPTLISIASLGALVVLGIFFLNFVASRSQSLPQTYSGPLSPTSISISQKSSFLLYVASHERKPVIRRKNIATTTQDLVESAQSSHIP